ncbi:MAG: hypothetical protein AMXMBFR82_06480 [Candidatus Hydrogenedentota bacterium]
MRTILILLATICCPVVSLSDSIRLEDGTLDDVYISESGTMYIICFPEDGSTKSISKSAVNPDQVMFSDDQNERERLKSRWLKSREEIVAEKERQEELERLRRERLERQAIERESADMHKREIERLKEREKKEAVEAEKRRAEEEQILATQAEQHEKDKRLARLAVFANQLPIQQVRTDQRAFIGKTFSFLAAVEVSSYYNYGWADAQASHHAFQLTCLGRDARDIGTAYVYMKRSEKSEALRRVVLSSSDPNDTVFICGLHFPANRFEDSMDLHAQLVDYISLEDFERLINEVKEDGSLVYLEGVIDRLRE